MNAVSKVFLAVAIALTLAACLKQRFLPDPYDPRLSQLTSKKTQVGTCYINDQVYINYWPESGISIGPQGLPYPRIYKIDNAGGEDSLDFQWELRLKEKGKIQNSQFSYISFRIPVDPNFAASNIMSLQGRRFGPDKCTVTLGLGRESGTGGIYFTNVAADTSGGKLYPYFYMSGIFEGAIGDSISIRKGRFDFVVEARNF